MKKLTPKQEKFVQLLVANGNASQAYRDTYNVKPTCKERTIWDEASRLKNTPEIMERIKQLQQELLLECKYTLEKSVKRDIDLIEKYETALNFISDPLSNDDDINRSILIIKAISVSGYNSAQDRLSKQHGFYERDNKQKAPPSFVMFDARGNREE